MKSASETILLSVSDREKSGAAVPSGNIVEFVRAIRRESRIGDGKSKMEKGVLRRVQKRKSEALKGRESGEQADAVEVHLPAVSHYVALELEVG